MYIKIFLFDLLTFSHSIFHYNNTFVSLLSTCPNWLFNMKVFILEYLLEMHDYNYFIFSFSHSYSSCQTNYKLFFTFVFIYIVNHYYMRFTMIKDSGLEENYLFGTEWQFFIFSTLKFVNLMNFLKIFVYSIVLVFSDLSFIFVFIFLRDLILLVFIPLISFYFVFFIWFCFILFYYILFYCILFYFILIL